MKKLISLTLAIVMLLCLAACGAQKPAAAVVEITPDNWYVYFEVRQTEPSVMDEQDGWRSEEYQYYIALKDEFRDGLLDQNDEADAGAYDFKDVVGGNEVQFSGTIDTVQGSCTPDGEVIPILAERDSQQFDSYFYYDENVKPEEMGSFYWAYRSYQDDVLTSADQLEGMSVTEVEGQLVMTPEAAATGEAAAATAEPPAFEATMPTGEAVEVPLTLDNWADYFEFIDEVKEYKNSFDEVESCTRYYYLALKDEYLMQVAPGSSATFQVAYKYGNNGYSFDGDYDGKVDFDYLYSGIGRFALGITGFGMEKDENGEFKENSTIEDINVVRVAGSLYLYE